MKYLIRNSRSKQYFNYGHWTADVEEAQDFASAETARAVAFQCALTNVELVSHIGVQPSESDEICSAISPSRI